MKIPKLELRIRRRVEVTFNRIQKFGYTSGSKILTLKPHSSGEGKVSPRNIKGKVILQTRTNPVALALKGVKKLNQEIVNKIASDFYRQALSAAGKRLQNHLKDPAVRLLRNKKQNARRRKT